MRKKKKVEESAAADSAIGMTKSADEVLPTESTADIGAGLKVDDESDVKRPELQGRQKNKPKFEHPGTNNQSRVVESEGE